MSPSVSLCPLMGDGGKLFTTSIRWNTTNAISIHPNKPFIFFYFFFLSLRFKWLVNSYRRLLFRTARQISLPTPLWETCSLGGSQVLIFWVSYESETAKMMVFLTSPLLNLHLTFVWQHPALTGPCQEKSIFFYISYFSVNYRPQIITCHGPMWKGKAYSTLFMTNLD